jgi:hypothetical protein
MKDQSAPGGHLSFAQMTPLEIHAWIQTRRAALQKKMQRERAYLDRRAARGIHTPTDEAYEQDQQLEAELLALLDALEDHVQEGWV